MVLFAAIGTMDTQAQYRQDPTVWGSTDNTVYSDDRGEYRWETRERRVWIPEYRTRGIFGVGARTIPGHYEMRNERVKVYLRGDRDNNRKGHPHGMPPGQRKKLGKYGDNRGYEDRNDRYERDDHDRDDDDRYERNNNGKKNKGKKDDDGD